MKSPTISFQHCSICASCSRSFRPRPCITFFSPSATETVRSGGGAFWGRPRHSARIFSRSFLSISKDPHSRGMKVFKVVPPWKRLYAVAADRLDRAAFHGFFAEVFFIGAFWLLEDVGVASVVVSCEICGRGFAAEVAVDALVVHVKFSSHVFRVF